MASTAVKATLNIAKDVSPLYYRILSKFPQNFTFCFAYGSAVKPQIGYQKKQNMIDLIYCVDNSYRWHGANIELNPAHYSSLRYLGKGFVARFQENWGAKVFFNTLVELKDENVMIKYGVVSQKDLIVDLLDWNDLYLAGRLHKPVEIIKHTNSSQLQNALQSNLRCAVHTALLILPETFSEYDFYFAISNLSYAGDFRMTFGENKNKVRNIVQPQLINFRELYRPILQQFHAYVDFPSGDAQCHQDLSPFLFVGNIMLSDESSSDSETGRFKGRSTKQVEKSKETSKDDRNRLSGRNRHDNRFRREFDRRRSDRDILRHSRDRSSRISPVSKHSRDRSPRRRRSRDRPHHHRDSRDTYRGKDRSQSKTKDHRSSSRDRRKSSKSRSFRSSGSKRDIKEEIKQIDAPLEKSDKKSVANEQHESSPDYKGKKSEIHKPSPVEVQKRQVRSPVKGHESDKSEEVQPGSYYSMIPAVVKEKSEESSEIDSSDDERLRAKLLNLEKELQKTRKKKHRKKHKRRTPKPDKDQDALVEVSSTTDVLQEKVVLETSCQADTTEVTSTEKNPIKESSEEGEILSDDPQDFEIDPTDLRHKIKRTHPKSEIKRSPDLREILRTKSDVCGPALPPHLKKQYDHTSASDTEGPILPPHLKTEKKNIGPTIPDEMRDVLAQTVPEAVDSSSEDDIGVGPMPVGSEEKWSSAHQRLEERALEMKMRKLDGHTLKETNIKSREKWMLELPEGKAKYIGLEARSFRAKEGPDMSDRSSWTDTPEDKARKAAGIPKEENSSETLQRDARSRHITKRDEEQELEAKKHKKKHKRNESLLELHEKKLKKKKKKEDKDDKKERRPFDRDVDLQVNRFDEAQKKSIIKKAQNLDSRFSSGEAKYL